MKKLLSIFATTMCLIAIYPQDANAQLGNIFKKTKKILKEVGGSNSTATNTETATAPQVAEVEFDNGVRMVNGCQKYADIVSVRAIGNSQDNKVLVTIKIVPKDLNYKQVKFEQDSNAFDENGDEYTGSNVYRTKSVVADVPANFNFATLENVPARVKKFAIVQSGFYFGPLAHDGKVIFKNLPIEWDVTE